MPIPSAQIVAFAADMRKVVPVMPIGRAAEAHRLRALNNAQAYPMDCATGRNCEYGPYGPNPSMVQCRWCGAEPKFYERRDFGTVTGRFFHTFSNVEDKDRSETAVGTHAVAAEPVETRLLHYLVKHHGGFGVWITDGSMPLSDAPFNGWNPGYGGSAWRLTEIVELCRERGSDTISELIETCRVFCQRVEAREVRSVRTYATLKALLARIDGEA